MLLLLFRQNTNIEYTVASVNNKNKTKKTEERNKTRRKKKESRTAKGKTPQYRNHIAITKDIGMEGRRRDHRRRGGGEEQRTGKTWNSDDPAAYEL